MQHQLANLEYVRKMYWPLLAASGYDPFMAQVAQNYLVAQELARYEAQRLALQSHYIKMQNMQWPKKQHGSFRNNQQHHSNASATPNNLNVAGLQISA